MSAFERIITVENAKVFIHNSNTVNVPLVPDYSGCRVNRYYDVVTICYGLVMQRQYLSRDNSVFKFINEEYLSTPTNIIKIPSHNRSHDGLYTKARGMMQKHQVNQWLGGKEYMSICFYRRPKKTRLQILLAQLCSSRSSRMPV